MKPLFVCLILSLVSACASKPLVTSRVTSFSEAQILKSEPHYFNTDGMSLADKQISLICKQAAIVSGVNVVDSPCKECRNVVVIGKIAGSRTENSIGMAPNYTTFNNGPYNRSSNAYGMQPVNQSHTITDREILINVFDSNGKNAEIFSSKINSSGTTKELSAVAHGMCLAGFREYPSNLTGKSFEITSD